MIKMMADKSISKGTDTNGKAHYRAQLIADTAAELAGVTEQDGVVWDFGSIAHAINDAMILQLNSSGNLVIQTGNDAGKTVDEVIAAASVQSAQGEQRKTDCIDLEKALNDEEEPTGEKKDVAEYEPERKEGSDGKSE